ncbi:LPS O-antigen chain length determinant protein WzzB [Pseudomonas sp. 13B_3.2_Bac1]|uniref:LPS O-antigen chain length determinant protein WzzB n=1 Tax=Pseudomonas sp. 13B_3.2_Bac1 TaxID=2971623 RepID=UPI0021C9E88A|nr:Wzz/FepE/Etk N-terminal domain-containing protein [Pseudomonas sp. 13B_3.2_Bac1]MCU1772404.1 Wzz/FepE/Etk N-terminal domain-containing protein [Pseudomonas sp. 13B_3.2_Bac1]
MKFLIQGHQDMQVNSGNEVANEGLDVYSLIFTIWRQKIVILCFAALGVAMAAAYAFVAQPIYEARSFITPPTQNDIQSLNKGRATLNLAPLTVKDVYSVFLKNLQAESLRREFFDRTYLPAQGQSDDPKGKFYEKLNKDLTIAPVGKDVNERFKIVLQDPDARRAQQWVDQYIARAQELSLQEINKNLAGEFDVAVQDFNQKISVLRDEGERARQDSLAKLREALIVAKAIGLEKPPIVSGNPNQSINIAGNMGGELTYMRGTKALEAEIANLQVRKSDDPFIKKLRGFEANYNFYKQLSQQFRKVNTFRMDGDVELSGEPVKPKTALIVLGGLIVGIMLGIIVVLLRNALLINRKELAGQNFRVDR